MLRYFTLVFAISLILNSAGSAEEREGSCYCKIEYKNSKKQRSRFCHPDMDIKTYGSCMAQATCDKECRRLLELPEHQTRLCTLHQIKKWRHDTGCTQTLYDVPTIAFHAPGQHASWKNKLPIGQWTSSSDSDKWQFRFEPVTGDRFNPNDANVISIAGHFNTDKRLDLAFYRPGGWNTLPVLLSWSESASSTEGYWTAINANFPTSVFNPGASNVVGIPIDFNKDGLTDIAFHRPGGAGWNTVPIAQAVGDGDLESRKG